MGAVLLLGLDVEGDSDVDGIGVRACNASKSWTVLLPGAAQQSRTWLYILSQP